MATHQVKVLAPPAHSLPRDIWALARPWFWLASLLPYYLGYLLATRRLVPAVGDLPTLAAGAVVVGPLVWLAVLAVNDAADLVGDRTNPRKADSPLTSGRLTPRDARRIAVAAGVLAVAVAVVVGPLFAAGTALTLALGWAYSCPPLRLKTRAGADVLVNAVAIGALGPLAGWATVRGLDGFPWLIALQGTLAGAALYLPTTMADYQSDRASGYTTIAVRLGLARTYRLGLLVWLAAALLSVVLAATGTVLPRSMLPLEVVMVPLLVAAYPRFARHARSFRGVVTLAALFLLPCVTFALTYTGVW